MPAIKIYYVENDSLDRLWLRAKSEKAAKFWAKVIFRANRLSTKGIKVLHWQYLKDGNPVVIISGVGNEWGYRHFLDHDCSDLFKEE